MMSSSHKQMLWWALPAIALVAWFVLRVCLPEGSTEPQADSVEPGPSVDSPSTDTPVMPEPSLEPEVPAEASADTIEVCPSQLFEGFATDYTGGPWATRVTDSTTVVVTCGVDAGTYHLYVCLLYTSDAADE